MDPQLVERARNGDERALEALVVANHARLFRVAHGILRDADLAEDATQRAFLEIWRSLPRLRDASRFVSWSVGLLIAACRRLEQGGAADDDAEDAAGSMDPATSDPFGLAIDRDQISRGFRQLSFDDRAALVMRYLSGLSPEDAGRALGLGEDAFETRTKAALEALDAALDQDAVSAGGLLAQAEGT
jgi:RNA polymerase sigma-70 factor (ECF subfamily)